MVVIVVLAAVAVYVLNVRVASAVDDDLDA
jgi:hypothetical protein